MVAANDHGLAMWRNLKIVRPEPKPNKNTKDEVNKQKLNRITSAETVDNDKMLKLTMSSHHIAKLPVVSGLVYQLYPKFFAQIGPTVASIDLFKYIRLSQLLHCPIVVL